MRRVLILLLVLLVPFKSVGAAVVPIVGSPNHQHAVHSHGVTLHGTGAQRDVHAHGAASAHDHAAAHAGCEGMAASVDADGDRVHEHACPHLAMATVLPVVFTIPADRAPPLVDAVPARPLTSVVLELLVPPPTRLS